MKGGLRAWGEASHFPEDSEHRRVPKIHPTVTEQPPRKRPAFCALRMNAHTLLSTKAWSAAGGQAFPHEPSLKQVLGVFPAQGLRVQRTEHAGPQESPWQVLPGDVFFPGRWFLLIQSSYSVVSRAPGRAWAYLSTFHTIATDGAEFLRRVSLPQRYGAVRDFTEFPLEANSSRMKQTGAERRRRCFWLLLPSFPHSLPFCKLAPPTLA